MAIIKRTRGVYHLAIRPFGRQVWINTQTTLKGEAQTIEREIMVACASQDYRNMCPQSRAVCVRLFRNQGWKLPPTLRDEESVTEELTLWSGVELFLKRPETKTAPNLQRIEQCLVHLVEYWGKDCPVSSIWVPEIKEYQASRLAEGAAPATVNKEKGVLSKLFGALVEARLTESNPCKLISKLSEKSGLREIYLSLPDFEKICTHLPLWLRPIAQTAFYTGMRRGEILGMTRDRTNLSKRIISLNPQHTKEQAFKWVPVHRELVPILSETMKISAIGTDLIFLKGGAPVSGDICVYPWQRALKLAGINPAFRFHDLRHTWVSNARRSGVSHEVIQAILGHSNRAKAVSERYGRISEGELLRAIDLMTFDYGETEILVSSKSC